MRMVWGLLTIIGLLTSIGEALAQSGGLLKNTEFGIYIGSAPGGGYDQYGRLLARNIGRHLTGTPTVIVRNMPGGGGREAINYIYNVAPRDGTAIGTTLRNVPLDPLLGNAEITKIDAMRITWIGSMNSDVNVCVSWASAPVKSIADAQAMPLIVGSTGASSANAILAKLLNAVADTKLKIVEGYKGSKEISLAMERGELQGTCGVTWDEVKSIYKSWLDEHKVVVLAQFATEKHRDLPDVPFIMDIAKNEADREMATLVVGSNKMGRPFFAPPDLTTARVQMLRTAFDATMADPQLLADADKMGLSVETMNGADVEALIKRLYQTPKPVVDATRKILGND